MISIITFDNVFSGIVGACIGAGVALLISWRQSVRSAQSNLRFILLELGYNLYHETDTFSVLKSSYHKTLTAIYELRSKTLLPWKRRKITSLCNLLMGHDPQSKARHCHVFPTQAESIKIVESLLYFIGDGSTNYKK